MKSIYELNVQELTAWIDSILNQDTRTNGQDALYSRLCQQRAKLLAG